MYPHQWRCSLQVSPISGRNSTARYSTVGVVRGGLKSMHGWVGRTQTTMSSWMPNCCPDPNVVLRLIGRGSDVTVPPVFEFFNGSKKLNVIIEGKEVTEAPDCGFELCDSSSLSVVCISRRVLSHLLMAGESVNDQSLLAPIQALGFKIFVDWTIAPTFRWEDEHRERGNTILQAYGVWYTRVKRGLPV